MPATIRKSLERVHRTLRQVSNLTFVCSWLALTATVFIVVMWIDVVPKVRESHALRNRVAGAAQRVEQSRSLRKDIAALATEIRAHDAELDKASLGALHASSIEEQVIRMVDRIRSANLHAVVVTRAAPAVHQDKVVMVAEFQGSFENVGVFLTEVGTTPPPGLSLLEAELSQEDNGELVVRLSWSLRRVARSSAPCRESREF